MENYKFLLVGVDKYLFEGYTPLSSITNDVNQLENIIKKYFVFDQIDTFKGEKAMKENIEAAINNLFLNCNETDTLILYWSGHGDRINNNGYLVCRDSKAEDVTNDKISMSELAKIIDSSKAKAVLVIVDCCYSGLLAKSRKDNAELQLNGKGKIIISASSDEVAFSDDSNGVFTKFLLAELYEVIQYEGYQKVDITELYSKIVISMEAANHKQIPNLRATIQGRFYLSLNNLTMSIPGIPRGRDIVNFKSQELVESLKLELKRNSGLDEEHYSKIIAPYLDIELPAGRAKALKINPLDEKRFFISMESFDWVKQSPVLIPGNMLLPVSSRLQAEEIHEAAKHNLVNIFGTLSKPNSNLFFSKLVLKYKDKQVELEGLKSRGPVRELKMNDMILWFTYNHDSTNFIVLNFSKDSGYSLGLLSTHDEQLFIKCNLSIHTEEVISEIMYYRHSDTCVIRVENKDKDGINSVYIYSMNHGVINKVMKVKQHETIIPINLDWYVILGKNTISLATSDNQIIYKHFLGKGYFHSIPIFHDFVSEFKFYISYKKQLYSVEFIINNLQVINLNIPGEVKGVINENYILFNCYDGLELYNINSKETKQIKIDSKDKLSYFNPGILIKQECYGYDNGRLDKLRYYLVFDYSDSFDSILSGRSLTSHVSVSHTGYCIANLTESNTIIIWE